MTVSKFKKENSVMRFKKALMLFGITAACSLAVLAPAAISTEDASAQPGPCPGGETFFAGDCIPNSQHFDICHVAGTADDPANFIDLNIPIVAIVGPAGHFNEDGTPAAGHEEDTFAPCEPPPPPVHITPFAAPVQPTCENLGQALLNLSDSEFIDWEVIGTVAPGETVTVIAHPLLGVILDGDVEFTFTFNEFDADSCLPPPPPGFANVCELATGEIIVVPEEDADDPAYGPVDDPACADDDTPPDDDGDNPPSVTPNSDNPNNSTELPFTL